MHRESLIADETHSVACISAECNRTIAAPLRDPQERRRAGCWKSVNVACGHQLGIGMGSAAVVYVFPAVWCVLVMGFFVVVAHTTTRRQIIGRDCKHRHLAREKQIAFEVVVE